MNHASVAKTIDVNDVQFCSAGKSGALEFHHILRDHTPEYKISL